METKRLAMTSDRQRFAAFEGTRQVRAELTQANLFGFRSAYSVYAKQIQSRPAPARNPANWLQKEEPARKVVRFRITVLNKPEKMKRVKIGASASSRRQVSGGRPGLPLTVPVCSERRVFSKC